MGLKRDGTIVSTEYTGDKQYYHGECEVSDWNNIAFVPMLHFPENWGVN